MPKHIYKTLDIYFQPLRKLCLKRKQSVAIMQIFKLKPNPSKINAFHDIVANEDYFDVTVKFLQYRTTFLIITT